jgi:hypothetical protein
MIPNDQDSTGFETAPFSVDVGEDFPLVSPQFNQDPWHSDDLFASKDSRQARLARLIMTPDERDELKHLTHGSY